MKRLASAQTCLAEKTSIKPGIVSYQHRIFSTKIIKGRQSFCLLRGIGHHLVCNAGKLGNLWRDWTAGINKGVKMIGYPAIVNSDCTDLGNPVFFSRKASGLYIKADKISIQGLFRLSHNSGNQIVDKISLHAIDHLKVRVLLTNGRFGIHGLWESLGHTVVCNGHSPLAPFVGLPNQVCGRGNAI